MIRNSSRGASAVSTRFPRTESARRRCCSPRNGLEGGLSTTAIDSVQPITNARRWPSVRAWHALAERSIAGMRVFESRLHYAFAGRQGTKAWEALAPLLAENEIP